MVLFSGVGDAVIVIGACDAGTDAAAVAAVAAAA